MILSLLHSVWQSLLGCVKGSTLQSVNDWLSCDMNWPLMTFTKTYFHFEKGPVSITYHWCYSLLMLQLTHLSKQTSESTLIDCFKKGVSNVVGEI